MYLQTLQLSEDEKKQVSKQSLTFNEQAQYKYILCIDGHVSAFRLSFELSYGSVLLIQDSKYKLWYRHLLVPYVHYIPVSADLSDLIEKIRWCKDNNEQCREIAMNSVKFYNEWLCKDSILDYLQIIIRKYSRGYDYSYRNIFDIQYEDELTLLTRAKIELENVKYSPVKKMPKYFRAVGNYKGIEQFLNTGGDKLLLIKDTIFLSKNTTVKIAGFTEKSDTFAEDF